MNMSWDGRLRKNNHDVMTICQHCMYHFDKLDRLFQKRTVIAMMICQLDDFFKHRGKSTCGWGKSTDDWWWFVNAYGHFDNVLKNNHDDWWWCVNHMRLFETLLGGMSLGCWGKSIDDWWWFVNAYMAILTKQVFQKTTRMIDDDVSTTCDFLQPCWEGGWGIGYYLIMIMRSFHNCQKTLSSNELFETDGTMHDDIAHAIKSDHHPCMWDENIRFWDWNLQATWKSWQWGIFLTHNGPSSPKKSWELSLKASIAALIDVSSPAGDDRFKLVK